MSLKLNLGSGRNPLPGYINVDKCGNPDVLHDLEIFPWPWETNSVSEVVLNHVLEHLGETTQTYFNIIKELYRICQPQSQISITVPHPRHDNFISDPTHVRPITIGGLRLLSKKENERTIKFANSPLAIYLDVDFEITSSEYVLDEPWMSSYTKKEITQKEVEDAVRKYNNVVSEIRVKLKVIK